MCWSYVGNSKSEMATLFILFLCGFRYFPSKPSSSRRCSWPFTSPSLASRKLQRKFFCGCQFWTLAARFPFEPWEGNPFEQAARIQLTGPHNWLNGCKRCKRLSSVVWFSPVLSNASLSGWLITCAHPEHEPELFWKPESPFTHHTPQFGRATSLTGICYGMFIPDIEEHIPSYCLAFATTKIGEESPFGKTPLKFALTSFGAYSCVLVGVPRQNSSVMPTPFLSIHEAKCVWEPNVLQMFLFSGLTLLYPRLRWTCGGSFLEVSL